ncbi:MAG: xylulokinase [Clostridiaceae bacterium]|nr:xylulokinase [Clostridiaceae bacterium]
MELLLGIDIGTSGTKVLLLRSDGKIIADLDRTYDFDQPANGWTEQDPDLWWNAVKELIPEIIQQNNVKAEDIRGIGIAGQMHSLVMLDKNDQVLRKAILWNDQRTGAQVDQINNIVGEARHIELTSNPPLTGFTSPKILWVRENEPEIYEKCCKILLPKDYIRFRLTGEYVSDVSDASGTGLLNVRERTWSKEILEDLAINSDLLPDLVESVEVSGYVTKEIADELGLIEGIPVVGGAGDNAAAAIGVGAIKDKTGFTTIGTSGVVFVHSSQPHTDAEGRVHTFCSAVPNQWHLMGVTLAAGSSLQWFRNRFCQEEQTIADTRGVDVYQVMDEMAEQINPGSEKLIFLPYLSGERTPHLDPNSRGVFFGLSTIHEKAHLIRAILEGVAFSLNDCLSILRNLKVDAESMMLTGGGASSPLWQEIIANIFNCTMNTCKSNQGPSLGAAILAGVGSGVFSNLEEGCDKVVQIKSTIVPEKQNEYSDYYNLYRELYPALKQQYLNLANI